uniref:Uncharacterized protein n=1 Tax=Setaria viridis TaxID=4556 RepID=A0A4U6U516_SETVI|nr:hypothetical protein SEVIR_7G165700v2 [Setaria viridis]
MRGRDEVPPRSREPQQVLTCRCHRPPADRLPGRPRRHAPTGAVAPTVLQGARAAAAHRRALPKSAADSGARIWVRGSREVLPTKKMIQKGSPVRLARVSV